MSGIKTAEEVKELLKQSGKQLSPTDRTAIISRVRKEGKYGGWGDEMTLARKIVGLVVVQDSAVNTAINSAASEYFKQTWIKGDAGSG